MAAPMLSSALARRRARRRFAAKACAARCLFVLSVAVASTAAGAQAANAVPHRAAAVPTADAMPGARSGVAADPAARSGTAATAAALARIGRPAMPAELRAWDIDVRGDFTGLPAGAGSVAAGQKTWDAVCASCHGVFGESNDVFTPLVGGTTAQDIERGRVQALASGNAPHRTTLMRASRLSTLWDYIHRAMPWNAPKSLTVDEVYGVLAYLLSLGEIVPADFTLTDRNIAEVERRLPNRHGKVFHPGLWEVGGKADIANIACMADCPVDGTLAASLPEAARNAQGNIAEQVRPFGPARGTDTAAPPRVEPVGAARTPTVK
jgi:cytochrome c